MLNGIKRFKKIVSVVGLGIWLLAGGAALTHAGDHDSDCDKRIHQAEARLQKEIDRHGEHSPQSDKRRHALEVRRSCGDHH
jgi:hypothetical protein